MSWDKPDRPADLYYRVLALFKDGEGADAFYFAKWLPACAGHRPWRADVERGDRAPVPGVTLTAFVDAAVGTAVAHAVGRSD